MSDDAVIKEWLNTALRSIFCPIVGCWPLHGCRCEYFYDEDAEAHVLEVWPVAVEEATEFEGNGHDRDDEGILYEFAEFDFLNLVKTVPLESFHFSQRRSIFEIAWKEGGHALVLRVHLVPAEVDEG